MREIKFRAWDKEWKQLLPWPSLTALNYYIESPQIELVQFTGLKDKNGKEIYEGDLLFSTKRELTYKVIWAEEFQCYWVRTIQGLPDDRMPSYQLFEDSEDQIEVIGNIYENPELTKQE